MTQAQVGTLSHEDFLIVLRIAVSRLPGKKLNITEDEIEAAKADTTPLTFGPWDSADAAGARRPACCIAIGDPLPNGARVVRTTPCSTPTCQEPLRLWRAPNGERRVTHGHHLVDLSNAENVHVIMSTGLFGKELATVVSTGQIPEGVDMDALLQQISELFPGRPVSFIDLAIRGGKGKSDPSASD